MNSLGVAELQEVSEIIYEKTKIKSILINVSFVPALFIPFIGWAYIVTMCECGRILGFQKTIKKLRRNYGKNYFPYGIFKEALY